MSKFVLTAQLKLQSPKNTRQVISDLRKQLSGVNIPVTVKGAAQAKRQVDSVAKSAKEASQQAQNMGRSFGLAFKRFAAFTVASRAVSLFTNTLAGAVDEAIDFQREMVKISQVTGKTMDDLKGLERTIFSLSKTLGVNSKELLSTTRILSQAGIKARELDVALTALAKTTLAPTFEDINETAEGAIAILAQFGKGVGALEQQLGSINAVAGQFAVESGDLIGAVRRTGGVFKEAGGSLEEFIGLFTSVRATTRESSESIATGLRTIFTRIQRPKTIEFLRQYGVELTDLDGKFVGPFEAIKRLNEALSGLGEGDIRFVKIAEQLGGFRQIGKVIPLLKEFQLAEEARQAAIDGGNSLTEDAAKAQIALATQIAKVKAEFAELIQNISNTGTFQALVKTTLSLASSLIKVADAIKPLIPLITMVAGIKLAKGLGNFASGFGGAIRGAASLDPRRKAQGGKILAFNRGGVVPGTGNRDTVPAMLQPGEFVIRKSSVNKIGTNKLAAMNAKGYAKGGMVVELQDNALGGFFLRPTMGDDSKSQNVAIGMEKGTASKNITDAGIIKSLAIKGALDPNKYIQSPQTGVAGLRSLGAKEQRALLTKVGAKSNFDYATGTAPGFTKNSRIVGTDGKINAKLLRSEKFKEMSEAEAKAELEDAMGGATGKATANVPMRFKGKVASMIFGDRKNSSLTSEVETAIKTKASDHLRSAVNELLAEGPVKDFLDGKGAGPLSIDTASAKNAIEENLLTVGGKGEASAVKTISGYVQEGLISAITGADVGGNDASFDFPVVGEVASKLKKYYGDVIAKESADAKPEADTPTAEAILRKYNNELAKGKDRFTKDSFVKSVKAFAKGGGVSDTVPALLTPGEFVLNKNAARKIGDSNLNSMNKSGQVQGFAKGGWVGFNKGGKAGAGVAGSGIADTSVFTSAITNAVSDIKNWQSVLQTITSNSDKVAAVMLSLEGDMNAYTNELVELNARAKAGADVQAEITAVNLKMKKDEEEYLSAMQSSVDLREQADAVTEKIIDAEDRKAAAISGGKQAKEAAKKGARSGSGSFKDMSSTANKMAAEAAKDKAEADKKAAEATEKNAATVQKSTMSMEKMAMVTTGVLTALQYLRPTIDENSGAIAKGFAMAVDGITQMVAIVGTAGAALAAFGVQLNIQTAKMAAQNAMDFFGGGGKVANKLGEKVSGGVKNLTSKVQGMGPMGKKLVGQGHKLSNKAMNLAGSARGAVASVGGRGLQAAGSVLPGALGAGATSAGTAAVSGAGAGVAGAGGGMAAAAGTATTAIAAVAGPTIAMTAAVYGVTAAMDALAGTQGDYEKAIEEGNVQAAGEAKLRQKNQKALNKFAMTTTAVGGVIGGVLGSVIPGAGTALGAAIGAVVGAIVGLIPKLITLGPTLVKKAVVGIGKFVMWVGKSLSNLGDNILNFLGKIPIIGIFFKAIKKVKDFIKGTFIKGFEYVKDKIMGVANFVTGIFSTLNDMTGGVLGKVAKAFMILVSPIYMVYKAFTSFRDTFGWLLGMDSSEAVKQQEEANAAMLIYTNNVEKNAKAQKDLLADIKSGESDQTFNEAMKGGGLTQNLSAALTAGQERVESGAVNLVMDKTGMFADEADNAMFGDAAANQAIVREDMKRQTNEETGQLETDEEMKKRLTDKGYREEDAQGLVDSQKAVTAEFNKATPQFQRLAKNVTLAGGEASTFEDFLSNLSDEDVAGLEAAGKMDDLEKIFDQQRKATLENIKYIEALNFGLRDATGAAVAMSATMDNIANSQTAGFNTFAASATTLGNAMTSAGKHISEAEMDSAIGDLETSMRSFGATEEQISGATGTIKGMQQVQANTDGALQATKAILKRDASTDPETIKQTLGDELLKGVEDPEAKGRLQAAIDKLDLSAESGNLEKIQAGKLDEVLKETLDPVAEAVTAEAIELANKRAEAENKLIAATQNRLKAEQEYIAAQKQAIDTQLEAGKLFEEFGGAKQTSEQVLGARTAQANLSLGAAGIGGLGAGNAADIRRALSDTQGKFIKQQDAANFGTLGMARGQAGPAFAGAAGVDEDKRQQLQDANKALVEFTRQRIGLIQEELAIAKQKNAAEKSALDSLLAGDIEGYLEQQQAAAAGAALRTGDASLASAFGAGALGAGLKTLEGQGLSGKEMERASSLALGGVGISDPRAAQVMAGTTAEEEALKAEGRELSQVLGEGAQMGADLKEMQVKAANVVIEAQKIEMGSLTGGAAGATGMWRGGPVYANRGMFIPRGTDTVPAMLTPGEFVVNRSAVQRGNNLALLMAMNGGGMGLGSAGGLGGAVGMSRGGMVYMADGGLLGKLKEAYGAAGSAVVGTGGDLSNMLQSGLGTIVDGIGSAFTAPVDGLKSLFEDSLGGKVFGMFEETVGKLMDFQLSVKVDPTNVNVNFNGANFLEGLRDDIKRELLEKVKEELSQGKFNESGEFQSKPGGLA